MRFKSFCLLVLTCIVLEASAKGAVITYLGQADDIGAAAPIIYGTDGYDLYGTTPVGTTSGQSFAGAGTRISKLPSYVSSVSFASGYQNGAGYGYTDIDNPAGGEVEAGNVSVYSPNAGQQLDLLSITLTGSVPTSFNLGWISNITPNQPNDIPDQVRVSQTVGGSGDSGLNAISKNPNAEIDEFFFNVSGGKAGDVLTLLGTETDVNPSNPEYIVSAAGLTFTQNSVPEPATFSIAALGVFGLLGRRRRGCRVGKY